MIRRPFFRARSHSGQTGRSLARAANPRPLPETGCTRRAPQANSPGARGHPFLFKSYCSHGLGLLDAGVGCLRFGESASDGETGGEARMSFARGGVAVSRPRRGAAERARKPDMGMPLRREIGVARATRIVALAPVGDCTRRSASGSSIESPRGLGAPAEQMSKQVRCPPPPRWTRRITWHVPHRLDGTPIAIAVTRKLFTTRYGGWGLRGSTT